MENLLRVNRDPHWQRLLAAFDQNAARRTKRAREYTTADSIKADNNKIANIVQATWPGPSGTSPRPYQTTDFDTQVTSTADEMVCGLQEFSASATPITRAEIAKMYTTYVTAVRCLQTSQNLNSYLTQALQQVLSHNQANATEQRTQSMPFWAMQLPADVLSVATPLRDMLNLCTFTYVCARFADFPFEFHV